jgi:hypothetical protein
MVEKERVMMIPSCESRYHNIQAIVFTSKQLEKLANPEAVDLIETIDDVRYDAQDLAKWLDTPAQKFINEVSVPIMVLSMLPQLKGPMTAYKGLQAAVAMAPRLEGMAVAFGAGAVAGYKKIKALFSERFDGDKDGVDSQPSKERKQNTPEEVKTFLEEKIQKGICEKWKVIKNKQTYRFLKQQGKFKKYDWLSHDELHHELEWFSNRGIHKGAIEPKQGTRYKIPDSTKNVKLG